MHQSTISENVIHVRSGGGVDLKGLERVTTSEWSVHRIGHPRSIAFRGDGRGMLTREKRMLLQHEMLMQRNDDVDFNTSGLELSTV